MVNNEKKDCPFEDEIVSYIYDEINGSKRLNFEDHLSRCSVCTDDFAAVSEARLSMFEWHRDAFADLPTPEIVIPYEPGSTAHSMVSSVWFGELRRFLSFTSFPATAAALVILTLGVGFAVLRYFVHTDGRVTAGAKVGTPRPAVNVPVDPPVSDSKPGEVAEKSVQDVRAIKTGRPEGVRNAVRPVRAAVRRPTIAERGLLAVDPGVKKAAVKMPLNSAPVLSNYDDNSDNSLRLADLFADVDG
jgi:hypothetical protein